APGLGVVSKLHGVVRADAARAGRRRRCWERDSRGYGAGSDWRAHYAVARGALRRRDGVSAILDRALAAGRDRGPRGPDSTTETLGSREPTSTTRRLLGAGRTQRHRPKVHARRDLRRATIPS